MKSTQKLYEVMYVSTIEAAVRINVVANITAQSRIWNAARDITGLLIFDGLRFCQQIEGRQKEVLALIEKISQDTRHSNVIVFHHGPLAGRRFRSFSLAFTNVDDIEVLARLEKLDGQAGVNAFVELLQTLELDG